VKELGELLRGARQREGITLDTAARATRIRVEYLEALEHGELRVLPGRAYATGFLRNYATFLRLNPDEILQTFYALTPPAAIAVRAATTVGLERLRRRFRRKLAAGLVTTLALSLTGNFVYNCLKPVEASTPPVNHKATSGMKRPMVPTPRVASSRTASLSVYAEAPTYIRVNVDHQHAFWGRIEAHHMRTWHGQGVWLETNRSNQLRVFANNSKLGMLTPQPGRVTLTVRPGTYRVKP
jgi:cytoskeleton protein RodZ